MENSQVGLPPGGSSKPGFVGTERGETLQIMATVATEEVLLDALYVGRNYRQVWRYGPAELPWTFSSKNPKTHIAKSLIRRCSHTACLCRVQVGVIGRGAFGVVIQAVDESTDPPQEVAIKLLPRGDLIRQFRTYVTREILHQSVLKHPFVVGLKEVGGCFCACLGHSFAVTSRPAAAHCVII